MNFELTQEQQMFRDTAKQFADQEMLPTLKKYERQHKVNFDVIKRMAELGFRSAHIPKKYGGAGLDYLSSAIIWEQLSMASWTQTLNSLGDVILGGTIILTAGNEEQRQQYLPPICRGEKMIAMAIVEPNVGSDANAVETSAVSDGNDWIINGTKNFITGGNISDTILVLAQTEPGKRQSGLVIIAVDKNTPGFSSEPMGMIGGWAADMANLSFSDCRVPKENTIGKVGRGLQNTMGGVDDARLFISAGCVGIAQSCLDSCIKYAKERNQFGKPIASFQLVQELIARMFAEIQAIRCLVYYAADLKSRSIPHAKELSSAKLLASELAVRISAEAIRIHGAYGCTDDFPVEHHYRDAILTTTLGGTLEIHKLTIGREILGINATI